MSLAATHVPLPDCDATTVHVPAVVSVADAPATVHTPGVVEANVTASDDVAVASSANVLDEIDRSARAAKVIS